MNEATSVTEWLNDLKAGDNDATQKLWEGYVEHVVRIANRRLGSRPRRATDEQDIAQEAFASFFHMRRGIGLRASEVSEAVAD